MQQHAAVLHAAVARAQPWALRRAALHPALPPLSTAVSLHRREPGAQHAEHHHRHAHARVLLRGLSAARFKSGDGAREGQVHKVEHERRGAGPLVHVRQCAVALLHALLLGLPRGFEIVACHRVRLRATTGGYIATRKQLAFLSRLIKKIRRRPSARQGGRPPR